MSKIFSFVVIVCSVTTTSAQWSYNGSSIYYNGGNVGIGTTTPSNIQGWDRVLDVRGGPHSKVLSSSNSGSFVTAMYSHASWMGGGGGFIGTETNHNLYFNTNYDPKMVLTTSGNFGVGTFTPAYKLHVKSPDIQLVLQTDGTSNNRGLVAFANSSGVLMGSMGLFGADETIRIGDALDYRMVIKQGGNIGIGTTNPLTKLHVDVSSSSTTYGSITSNNIGLMLRNTNAISNSYNILSFGDAAGWGVAHVGSIVTDQANHSGKLFFATKPQGSALVERMTIDDIGNVGIGTTAPDSKLTVKGTIHTQEVKVDLNGAVAPDYVFGKDYPLTSLEELKSYIDQNRHLPEIPSAKELEEEGINLKVMNLLLLKKVEELTLYHLEAIDRIRALEEEFKKLKKQR